MKDSIEIKDNEIIDVVDEFDYSTQQDSYNECFIKWRKNKENPYAYNFVSNKKESVFVDGQGFVSKSPEEAESEVLYRVLYVIGIAMLSIVLIEDVLDKVLVQILHAFGVDIHNSFFNSVIYGGRTEVVVVMIIITLLKLVVPLGITHAKFKMPPKLSFPSALKDSGELFATIATAMIVSVILGIPSAYSYETKEIYTFFKMWEADVSVWGNEEFIIYTILDVIVVSVMFEALYRGAMFHALRQFGDVYAIIITSLLSGLITRDYSTMLGTILISFVAASGALRSGTIFSAISARIIYKMYMLALTIIETDTGSNMYLTRNMFMIGVFVLGLLIFGIVSLNKERRTRRTVAKFKDYLSLKSKLLIPIKVLPISAVIAISVLAAAMYYFV